MPKEQQTMRLSWIKEIAPKVHHLAFSPEEPMDYIPGQFITLHLTHDHREVRRSYSIANPPPNPFDPTQDPAPCIEFAISYLPSGVASEYLFNLKPGDTVTFSGPAGRLILQEPHPKRYVLIATGTGVTPYRAMLNQIQQLIQKEEIQFLLLLGVRNPEECLYQDELKAFAADNPGFDFHIFYSRFNLDPNHALNEHQGYVQTGFDQFNLNPERDKIYLCGNPNMIDTAFDQLEKCGFTMRNVRREKYISSK
jgi:ferredoxin-NADP reductase